MASSIDIAWSTIEGGKYAGKTLPQLLFADPDYFFFQYRGGHSFSEIRWQADIIAARAQHIRIPAKDGVKRVAEYLVAPADHQRFDCVVMIPETEALPPGFESRGRKDALDLSYPRVIAPADRNAGKRFVEQIKELILGDRWQRINKRIAGEFFNEQSHFSSFALPRVTTW